MIPHYEQKLILHLKLLKLFLWVTKEYSRGYEMLDIGKLNIYMLKLVQKRKMDPVILGTKLWMNYKRILWIKHMVLLY